jgi:galactokinase
LIRSLSLAVLTLQSAKKKVSTLENIATAFDKLYGARPRIYSAPGRVNLIGEHTDYNEGFVMPAAIDFSTCVAVSPRNDRSIVIQSDQFSGKAELDLDRPPKQGRRHWSDYPFGVAIKLEEAGHRLNGANLLVKGNVPIGSGLSSSAAIEVATALALLDNSNASIDRLALAKICQKAENEFVGARSGIMDQFIACFAEKDYAIMLDCRSLESTPLPLPADAKLVVCNTMIKHELASGEYNQRREECEAGVRILARHLPNVTSLRDVTADDLEHLRSELPEIIYQRCRHVVTENDRVLRAADALRSGDLLLFGKLMDESHRSLRDDYQVSCKELDLMVEFANEVEGVFGARMTGGGFGGCTINLVASDRVDAFKQYVAPRYAEAVGKDPEIYMCSAAPAASRVH